MSGVQGAVTAVTIPSSYCVFSARDKFPGPGPLRGLSPPVYKYGQARAPPHSVCGESRHNEVLGGSSVFFENRIKSLFSFLVSSLMIIQRATLLKVV